jgi:hypothetical protein
MSGSSDGPRVGSAAPMTALGGYPRAPSDALDLPSPNVCVEVSRTRRRRGLTAVRLNLVLATLIGLARAAWPVTEAGAQRWLRGA